MKALLVSFSYVLYIFGLFYLALFGFSNVFEMRPFLLRVTSAELDHHGAFETLLYFCPALLR